MTQNVKENPKKYYKCVDRQLKSIVVYDNNPFSIQYKIDEWVKPNFAGTRLMVFDDREKAIDFLNAWIGDVYECEVKNPVKTYSLLMPFYFYLTDGYENCYLQELESMKLYNLFVDVDKNKRQHKSTKELAKKIQNIVKNSVMWDKVKPMEGTVFCSAVKLLKKIS